MIVYTEKNYEKQMNRPPAFPDGIGLYNMADRVDALGGVFRVEYDKGFKILKSVPLTTNEEGA